MPLGVTTSTSSPSFLPISARAIGEPIESRPAFDVGLVLADDPVTRLATVLDVEKTHRGAEHHLAARVDCRDVDDLRIAELALDVANPRLHEALLLFRSVVLGILFQIAMRACSSDRGCDLRAFLELQPLQLLFEQCGAACG